MAVVQVKMSGTTLDHAEFINAASEDTLKSILSQMKILDAINNRQKNYFTNKTLIDKKDSDNLLSILKLLQNKSAQKNNNEEETSKNKDISNELESTGDAAKETSNELLEAGEAAGEVAEVAGGVTAGFSTMIPAIGEVVGLLGSLVVAFEVVNVLSIFGHTVGRTIDLFVKGNDKLVDYFNVAYNGLSQLPLIGELLNLFLEPIQKAIEIMSSWNDQLYKLSAVGANFNNNLLQMRGAAANAGLTLENFASIIEANAPILSQFGGSVTEGAKIFSRINGIVLNQFGASLQEMGINLSNFAGELPNLLGLMAPGALARRESDEQLARSAVALTKEMDLQTKLTGQARSEQTKLLEQQQTNAAFEAKLVTLSTDQQDKVRKAMADANASFGELGGEMVRARVLGIKPLSEDAILFQSTMSGTVSHLNNMSDAALNASVSQQTFSKITDNEMSGAIYDAAQTVKDSGNLLRAQTAGVGGTVGSFGAMVTTVIDKNKSMLNSTEVEIRANRERARSSQNVTDANKRTFDNFSRGIDSLRAGFFDKFISPLAGAFSPIIDTVSKVIAGFDDFSVGLAKDLAGPIAAFSEVIGSSIEKIYNWFRNSETVNAIMNFFTQIKNWVLNMFTKHFGPGGFLDNILARLTKWMSNFNGNQIEEWKNKLVHAWDRFMEMLPKLEEIVNRMLYALQHPATLLPGGGFEQQFQNQQSSQQLRTNMEDWKSSHNDTEDFHAEIANYITNPDLFKDKDRVKQIKEYIGTHPEDVSNIISEKDASGKSSITKAEAESTIHKATVSEPPAYITESQQAYRSRLVDDEIRDLLQKIADHTKQTAQNTN